MGAPQIQNYGFVGFKNLHSGIVWYLFGEQTGFIYRDYRFNSGFDTYVHIVLAECGSDMY